MDSLVAFTLLTGERVTLDIVYLQDSFLKDLTSDLGNVPSDITLPLELTLDEFNAIKLVLEGKLKISILSHELVFKADKYQFFNATLTRDIFAFNERQLARTSKLERFLSKNTDIILLSKSHYYKLKDKMLEDVIPFTVMKTYYREIKTIIFYNNVLGYHHIVNHCKITKGQDANRIKYEMLVKRCLVKKLCNGYSTQLKFEKRKNRIDNFNIIVDILEDSVMSPCDNQALYSNDLETFLYGISRIQKSVNQRSPLFLYEYDTYKDQLEPSVVPRDIDSKSLCKRIKKSNIQNELRKLRKQSQVVGDESDFNFEDGNVEVNMLFALYGFIRE